MHSRYLKSKVYQKEATRCFIDYRNDFDSVDHVKMWNVLRKMEFKNFSLSSWETYIQVRKPQYRQNVVKPTCSMLAKACNKLYTLPLFIHLISWIYILREAGLEEYKYRFKSERGNINNQCYANGTILMAENAKDL